MKPTEKTVGFCFLRVKKIPPSAGKQKGGEKTKNTIQ
jgi:hypothetical protein